MNDLAVAHQSTTELNHTVAVFDTGSGCFQINHSKSSVSIHELLTIPV
ncbi:hypothetical protein LRHMDP2_720 [Lacticaseibacillus rhamnosus LRHMDP2]|nr:hypothetical protein LRHMDP2_720 [Lacticaseibacillus rhamnosus LRHMDP2]